MKGIVLAGGKATRLRPCTTVVNKHLLPIYNKPMVFYPIETLTSMGIQDILVILGEYSCGDLMRLIKNGDEVNARITYKYQEEANGIANAILLGEQFANGDDITVILGDNVFIGNIEPHTPPHIYLTSSNTPERFGVAEVADGAIVKIIEKPRNPVSNLIVTGLYIYPNNVFDFIKTMSPSDRGEYEVTDINNHYLPGMSYTVLKNEWIDTGTFESLYQANGIVRDLHKPS